MRNVSVRPQTADLTAWQQRRTGHWSDWPAERLVRCKAELAAAGRPARVSVVLPALNEEATVGAIVTTLREELVLRHPVIDELVVVDSGSTDATAAVAAAAGARVIAASAVLPEHGSVPGKGEVLWKSLFATTGDVIAFIDADLVDMGAHFVAALVGPLLTDPSLAFVKGFHERPLATTAGVAPAGGGRVTELVARPLLNLYWPELAGFVQPLSGEYAARREVLEQVPFVAGYGVEVGLLIDLLDLVGLDAMAQVDLGRRVHSHQSDAALGRMSSAIIQTVLRRLAAAEGRPETPVNTALMQFRSGPDGHAATTTHVEVTERPAAATVRPRTAAGASGRWRPVRRPA